MDELQRFKQAREMISDPARWCQGADAKDAQGERVSAHSPQAVAWCAIGALQAVLGPWEHSPALLLRLDSVAREYYRELTDTPVRFNIAEVNDSIGHAHVLACYDRVIAALEAQEGV